MIPQMTCFQSIDHKSRVQYHPDTHNILELKKNLEFNYGHIYEILANVRRLVMAKMGNKKSIWSSR